ncbi:MAG: glucosaminidase domain-containing protein [Saprospiraceae bacterium]|nr:glucosaminidase domain-containing protein [Saprospiraceae bacterium]
MNWKFLKTNWFTIALVLLLLMAIGRKFVPSKSSGSATPSQKEQPAAKIEKYTDTEAQAMLDFSSEAPAKSAKPVADKAASIAFVRRFEQVAISERKKFGIPSSVLLGCAFVNSTAGKAEWVNRTNNFFALPCSSDWEGGTAQIDERCLRRYETAWASFRDFSIHLTSQEWYGGVKKSAGKDWKKWAKELSKRGVSEVPDFGRRLEEAIQTYRLYDLDEL